MHKSCGYMNIPNIRITIGWAVVYYNYCRSVLLITLANHILSQKK